jgi:DNA-3-methyladenine glycosylase I
MSDGIIIGDDGRGRCWWGASTPAYAAYHDDEWGRPTADDRWIFEKLCLEGFQSGLSWLTILNKRENFRRAFDNFEVDVVSRYGTVEIDALMADSGIVRNRAKIEATIHNAGRAVALRDEFGSLAAFMWRFEPPAESRPAVIDKSALPALVKTPASAALSRELKRRGWRFVGPTTAYAFMQAAGIVNDHLEGCAARARCEAERAVFGRPHPAAPQPTPGR